MLIRIFFTVLILAFVLTVRVLARKVARMEASGEAEV